MTRIQIFDVRTGAPARKEDWYDPLTQENFGRNDFHLVVDGTYVPASVAYQEDGTANVTFVKEFLGEHRALLSISLRELAVCLGELQFVLDGECATACGPVERVGAMMTHYIADNPSAFGDQDWWHVQIYVDHPAFLWSESWSITELYAQLGEAVKHERATYPFELSSYTEEHAGLWFEYEAWNLDRTLGDVVDECTGHIWRVFNLARAALVVAHPQQALTTLFEFPEPVRSACEQYLLYFGQFLRDLGIEATTALTEHASQVLFSVKPAEGPEALAKIKDALAIYLSLPDAPTFEEEATGAKGVAVAQLSANVLHYKSQLMLAQAVLQAKDATIEAYRLRNSMLTGRGASQWDREGETEPLLGEFVAVRPVASHGLVLNLPAIFRALKRRWSGTM